MTDAPVADVELDDPTQPCPVYGAECRAPTVPHPSYGELRHVIAGIWHTAAEWHRWDEHPGEALVLDDVPGDEDRCASELEHPDLGPLRCQRESGHEPPPEGGSDHWHRDPDGNGGAAWG